MAGSTFYFPIGAQRILTPDDGEEALNYEEQQEAWILRDRAVEDFLRDVAQTADVAILDENGLIPADQLGQGATGTSVFLRGDRQWAVVPGAVAGTHSMGISSNGNTAGSTGLVTGTAVRLMLVGGNNITLSQSSNGASATVTIIGTSGGGGAGSNTLGMSNLGNTSGTTGVVSDTAVRYLLAGGNGVTLSQSLNGASGTVTISVANQTNQSLGLYASSNTTLTSSGTADARSLSVRGVGAISVGVSASEVLLSVAAQTAESQSGGISNLGNTSGTSGIASGAQMRLLFAGGNNVTLSQSVNGASATITISGPNTAAQSAQTLGLYASSNTTAGSSSGTADARSLSFRGVGAASIGVSASEVIISVPNVVAQTNQSLGVYASSQTTGAASSTTVDARSVTLVGQGGVSVGASAGSIIISGGAGGGTTGSYLAVNTANFLASATTAASRTNPHFVMVEVHQPLALSVIDVAVSNTLGSTANTRTGAVAFSFTYGLYTESGDTITPLVGSTTQTTYSWASNSAAYSSLTGPRWLTLPLATTIPPDRYYFGFQFSSNTSSVGANTTSLNWGMNLVYGSVLTATHFADLGAAPSATLGNRGFQGQMVGTSLSATNQTVQRSQVSQSGAPLLYANNVLILRNVAR